MESPEFEYITDTNTGLTFLKETRIENGNAVVSLSLANELYVSQGRIYAKEFQPNKISVDNILRSH